MESVRIIEEIEKVENNRILVKGNPEFENTEIRFYGKNNILFLGKDVHLTDTRIIFNGSDSVVFLKSNRFPYKLDISLFNHNVFFMDSDNYMNGKLHCVLSEQKNIIVGREGLFSFDIWIRLADSHLLYDGNTHQRINPSKSVYIGDHVWVGQGAMILKGSMIGSGSVIGANALVSKKIPSNSVVGGNPGRLIKDRIFWEKTCVNSFMEEETRRSQIYAGNDFLYERDDTTIQLDKLECELNSSENSEIALKKIRKLLAKNKNKNRFFIGQQKQKTFFKWKKQF